MSETASRCCCPSPHRYECIEIRYGVGRGWDPEDADALAGEACECACHDEWEDDDDDD